MKEENTRLRILICIGGGPEAYAGIKFAARLSQQSCADIALLYVRPLDSGLKSGGMEVRVARENLLDWGLELPGMRHLRTARDILLELGEISKESADAWQHREISGDPAGEYVRKYYNPCGGTISLRLRISSDVTSAVVDEAERLGADIVIVGGSEDPASGFKKLLTPKSLALRIASHTSRSVIVARQLEPGHGHLVCVQDTDRSREMIPRAIRYAHACQCSVTILSVAESEEQRQEAAAAVAHAATAFRDAGIEPQGCVVRVGVPAEVIAETGEEFSLIVMAESEKPWFAKAFSVAHEVAAKARNSVLIVK
ncbi:universal stress protein [uncultured Pseudodesulfovibrio sp.]|uniref:universal stress protein n=1 Tax=uncultured Pseudodesulfovibrio sp. TaxID=2035858 RepID=UPI0029C9AB3F|nr:universal stress protein [uncultured Pseudodesulfovibrio sp.]